MSAALQAAVYPRSIADKKDWFRAWLIIVAKGPAQVGCYSR